MKCGKQYAGRPAKQGQNIGAKARARMPREGLWRTVCDYVAGMTDRYALEEVRRFGLDDRAAGVLHPG